MKLLLKGVTMLFADCRASDDDDERGGLFYRLPSMSGPSAHGLPGGPHQAAPPLL